jgi:hypothetical protein
MAQLGMKTQTMRALWISSPALAPTIIRLSSS